MNRNLTVKAGNCKHRRYVPGLLSKIATGAADPTTVLTQQEGIPAVLPGGPGLRAVGGHA